MAIAFRNALRLTGINEFGRESCPPAPVSKALGSLKWQIPSMKWNLKCSSKESDNFETPVEATRSNSWWEVAHDNFREIASEQDLVDSLMNAGNKLVVVQFYAPSCGGCRTLHPKMYQIADEHREAIFLKVNCDVHKSLCYNLTVRVLPFFHFFRGTEGRICSFSCTLNTIYKLKNALKKHGIEQSGPEPAKGSNESPVKGFDEGELLDLSSVEVSRNSGDFALNAV